MIRYDFGRATKAFLTRLLTVALCLLPTPSGAYWQSVSQQLTDLDATNTDNACLAVSGTTQEFTNKNLGGGKPGRVIAVTVNWSDSTLAGTAEVTSVTIGGEVGVRAVRAVGDDQNSNSEIWYAQVSTGSTGTITVVTSTAVDGMVIGVYRLINFIGIAETATGTTTATVNNRSAGFVTLAGAGRRVDVSTSLSNMANNYSVACGSFLWGVNASNLATVAGSLATTISPTSDTPLIAMATWTNAATGLIAGAQVKKNANQTGQDYRTAYPGSQVGWDGEDFDTDDFHSNTVANQCLTIPAKYNGYYAVVSVTVMVSNFSTGNVLATTIFRDGVIFNGSTSQLRNNGLGANGVSTDGWSQTRSHVVQVTTGECYSAYLHVTVDSSIDVIAQQSRFSIHIIGQTVVGALVKNSIDQTANYNFTDITYDTDVYDTDAFHDTGSNTQRLVIPAAFDGRHVIVKATVKIANIGVNSTTFFNIAKNGVVFIGQPVLAGQTGGTGGNTGNIDIETPPILVATGDIFTSNLFTSDTSVTVAANGTFFSVQVLPASFAGVLASLNANVTANWTTPTAVAWDGADVYDTDAIHNPASNNTKFIIPASLNGRYALLHTQIAGSTDLTLNGTISVGILKGASTSYAGFGGLSGHNGTFTGPYIQANSMIVQLITGDEYTAVFWNVTDTSSTITAAAAAFSLQVIGPLNYLLDPANDNQPMFLARVG